ncbi:MAG: hypothetical protein SH817_06285 [Leptospira sp.]|nr:hypothetical protein [Leptospira sp.]
MLHPKIKEYSTLTKSKINTWIKRFYNIGTEKEKTSREFQFLFLSWFFLLLFFTFFILAEKNPFNLLVPFNVFQVPHNDSRDEIKIFISDGDKNQIPVIRKLLVSEDKDIFINQLISEVGSPPYFSVEESASLKDKIFSPKKLLDLHDSIKSIWFRENNTKLILDWNYGQLESVMSGYRLPQNRASSLELEEDSQTSAPIDTITYYSGGETLKREDESVTQSRRLKALSATFKAIDATLFLNFPELKIIEHHLDGNRKPILGLDYLIQDQKLRE